MFSLIFFSFFFLFIALSMTCRAAPPFFAASSTYCFWFTLAFYFHLLTIMIFFPYASFRFIYHILWAFNCLMRRSHGRKFLNKRMFPTIRLSIQFKRIQNTGQIDEQDKNNNYCRVFLLTTVVFNGQRVTSYRSILHRD